MAIDVDAAGGGGGGLGVTGTGEVELGDVCAIAAEGLAFDKLIETSAMAVVEAQVETIDPPANVISAAASPHSTIVEVRVVDSQTPGGNVLLGTEMLRNMLVAVNTGHVPSHCRLVAPVMLK